MQQASKLGDLVINLGSGILWKSFYVIYLLSEGYCFERNPFFVIPYPIVIIPFNPR